MIEFPEEFLKDFQTTYVADVVDMREEKINSIEQHLCLSKEDAYKFFKYHLDLMKELSHGGSCVDYVAHKYNGDFPVIAFGQMYAKQTFQTYRLIREMKYW